MEFLTSLTSNNTLLLFNSEMPGEVTEVPVTGIEGTLIGIDTRPSNGLIYGITTANKIYTLAPNGFDMGSFNRDFILTQEEFNELRNGALYVNLHTNNFNGGELRGQIQVEPENDIVALGIPIEESQEVGATTPPDGPAMGAFNVLYDDATNTLRMSGTFNNLTSSLLPVGNPDVEGNPTSSIHLHDGVAGENGPIIRNFTVDESGAFEGNFTLTDEEEVLLLDGALYVNLHTQNFNGGELRGQVAVDVENDVVAFGIPIEESQQVGAVIPPDGPAMGMFDLVYDNSTQNLTVEGEFSNLTSPLFPIGPTVDVVGNPQSAVHLHNGVAGENGPIIRNLTTDDEVATFVSELNIPFNAGVVSGFDFNPVADRLRLVGDNDQNFRINVDTGAVIEDGTLTFAEDDPNAGINPNVTAAAYTNAIAAPTTTALYNIDPLLDQLLLQNPPNAGTQVTIGDLGFDFDVVGGFDIISAAEGDNTAFAISDAMLYSVDLETGAATSLGMIGDDANLEILGFTALAMDDDMGMEPNAGQQTIMVEAGDMQVVENFGGTGRGATLEQAIIDEIDTLQFNGDGFTAENLQLMQMSNDLEITFLGDETGTAIVLQNFALEDLDNLRQETGGNIDRGNILFGNESGFEDSFDVFNADSTQDFLWNRNSVTFLNNLNNQVRGFNQSDDVINGLGGDDELNGLSGNDILRGGDGDDLLDGGHGDDRYMGGAGADRFVFAAGAGIDTITDFEIGVDQILLGSGLSTNTVKLFELNNDTLVLTQGNNELLGIVQSVTGLNMSVFA